MPRPIPPEFLELGAQLAPSVVGPLLSKALGIQVQLGPEQEASIAKAASWIIPQLAERAAAPQDSAAETLRQARAYVFLGQQWPAIPGDMLGAAVHALIFAPVPPREITAPDGSKALEADSAEEALRYKFAARLLDQLQGPMTARIRELASAQQASAQTAAEPPQK